MNNAVGKRNIAVNGRYIRGYGVPKYGVEKVATTTKKSIEVIAKEVIDGKWGNGTARTQKLTAAGYNASEVQAKVNEMLSVKTVKVGCRVKVKSGAKSYEGKSVASFVYTKVYTVDQLNGKRAVLDIKGICTAFNINDLIVQ